MKPRKCEVCGKIPKVKNLSGDGETWTFTCGCGIEGSITMCGRKTKEIAIEMYNAMYNDLKPQKDDVVITIRITKENRLSIGCDTKADDYKERFLKNKEKIVEMVKNFMDD